MAATVAALSAEVINVREQARLEAMAFEISEGRPHAGLATSGSIYYNTTFSPWPPQFRFL